MNVTPNYLQEKAGATVDNFLGVLWQCNYQGRIEPSELWLTERASELQDTDAYGSLLGIAQNADRREQSDWIQDGLELLASQVDAHYVPAIEVIHADQLYKLLTFTYQCT